MLKALSNLSEISLLIKKKKVIVLVDYDGTLTPIVSKPELALLNEKRRGILRKLSQKYPLAVISGRSLAEVKKLVRLKDIFYAGNHGLEIEGSGHKFIYGPALKFKSRFSKLENDLKYSLGKIPGIIVENKGFTLALHYRLVNPARLKEVRKVLDETIKNYYGIKVSYGKKVFDIKPVFSWNKGKAAEWIIRSLSCRRAMPIYLGDDQTDEDAFLALRKKGITILVAEKEKSSSAEYRLKDVFEVYKFLNWLKKYDD
ncbi:MAG: trehalose-phosphatase [Candidatus Nealsonbacteria bacterium]